MGRGVYKQPGGKLVGVTARLRDGYCHIDGDFFIDGNEDRAHEMLLDIERTLVAGRSIRDIPQQYPDVALVGMTMQGIETAFRRPLRKMTPFPKSGNRKRHCRESHRRGHRITLRRATNSAS